MGLHNKVPSFILRLHSQRDYQHNQPQSEIVLYTASGCPCVYHVCASTTIARLVHPYTFPPYYTTCMMFDCSSIAGILGNAADFYDTNPNTSTTDGSMDRRQMMIAFDMRCVGFMMAKMVLQELMEPLIFMKFKSFLAKGNDPSLQTLGRNSSSGNAELQILDRNCGAGWNLLSLLIAAKPSERIRWRVDPSMDIIRWGLGSTTVPITEEYIYGHQQRSRLAHFIEFMEMLNPHSKPKNWLALLPGKWRLLTSKSNTTFSLTSDISFTVFMGQDWPHDKAGVVGKLGVDSSFRLTSGKQLYLKDGKDTTFFPSTSNTENSIVKKLSGKRWRKALPSFKEFPSSLPVAKLVPSEVEVTMSLNDPLGKNVYAAKNAVHEVRTQVPPEMFDLSKLVWGTYVDTRLLVLRGVSGSALLFTRSCANGNCR
ncbi:OBP3-responsive protein 1 [Actinidia rufa]|uniref:OBP3-responsive protein 1 n=1 Tax=Actinidia rufa TaxID=165716 RepID=A0A7J0ED16_9ERIC|nr:OBP3-responsive protein 1 [Actinidia rufa]